MCIIACKNSSLPFWSDETIKTMFDRNPDGAGLMFRKADGTVHIEKGFFDVKGLLAYVHKNIKQLAKADVVMHFRIKTSGKKDALNCHPYPVWQNNLSTSVDVKLGMAHNGILDGYGWRGNEEINDTQVFINEIVKQLPHSFLRNKGIVSLIKKAIGTNKLAFLDDEGIHVIGDFIEDGGYLYSNSSYVGFLPRSFISSYTVAGKKDASKKYAFDDDYLPASYSSKKNGSKEVTVVKAEKRDDFTWAEEMQKNARVVNQELSKQQQVLYNWTYTALEGALQKKFLLNQKEIGRVKSNMKELGIKYGQTLRKDLFTLLLKWLEYSCDEKTYVYRTDATPTYYYSAGYVYHVDTHARKVTRERRANNTFSD